MKRQILLLLLVFCFSYSFSQIESDINLTYQEQKIDDGGTGIYSKGNGSFLFRTVMSKDILGGTRVQKSFEIAREELKKFASDRNATYNEIDANYNKGRNTIRIVFELKNKDGSNYLTRDESIKAIKELKELLDLGIITQEEFDKKAIIYKRTILNH